MLAVHEPVGGTRPRCGLSTSYSYDALDRVTSITSPQVTNRVTGTIHRAVTSIVYDEDGNVVSQTVTDTTGGDAPRSVTCTCNTHGQLESQTDNHGCHHLHL